jgi:hypothetical protein
LAFGFFSQLFDVGVMDFFVLLCPFLFFCITSLFINACAFFKDRLTNSIFYRAGKSFTMSGFGSHLGINYRSILKVFEILETKKKSAAGAGAEAKAGAHAPESGFSFAVEMTMMTVQEETVYDLLTPAVIAAMEAAASEKGTSLVSRRKSYKFDTVVVKYDPATEDIDVPGLTARPILSASDAMLLYARACAAAAPGMFVPFALLSEYTQICRL